MRILTVIALLLASTEAIRIYKADDVSEEPPKPQAKSEAKPQEGTAVDDTRNGRGQHNEAIANQKMVNDFKNHSDGVAAGSGVPKQQKQSPPKEEAKVLDKEAQDILDEKKAAAIKAREDRENPKKLAEPTLPKAKSEASPNEGSAVDDSKNGQAQHRAAKRAQDELDTYKAQAAGVAAGVGVPLKEEKPAPKEPAKQDDPEVKAIQAEREAAAAKAKEEKENPKKKEEPKLPKAKSESKPLEGSAVDDSPNGKAQHGEAKRNQDTVNDYKNIARGVAEGVGAIKQQAKQMGEETKIEIIKDQIKKLNDETK